MREGNLITKRIVLPLPNSPEIDSNFLYRYAENWVEDTYGIGDYFCRTSEIDPDYYKLINYKIEIIDTYAEGKTTRLVIRFPSLIYPPQIVNMILTYFVDLMNKTMVNKTFNVNINKSANLSS